jgi:hypothetical protein
MEIVVSEDNQLFYSVNSFFPKGTILLISGAFCFTPFVPPISEELSQIDVANLQVKLLLKMEYASIIGVCNGEIWWSNERLHLLDAGYRCSTRVIKNWKLTKEQQVFCIKYRPDLIGAIPELDPELRKKYKAELNLAGIEI